MAPLKKNQNDSSTSKNHHKKTKRRRSSNKLNFIYKHLANLYDEEAKKPAKNSNANSSQKKGQKPKLDDKSKNADSENSYRVSDSDDIRVQSIVRKALDIGVENGYLVPTDTSCRVLRVASNLVELENRKRKHEISKSNDKNGENDEVLDKRRRRKRSKGRKRRRRSHSRGKRRMAKNEELEDMAEAKEDEDENSQEDQDDEEEMEKKTNKQEEDKGNVRKTRSNAPDREVKDAKKKENSDDESADVEHDKKG
ncbi:uncharacterized protein DDB_G0283697-like isoform X3 [Belonocnema kinseyi]|uniref:uncharacterized protein DDB_G0283697-like isoform X3 n=1 Tax=Belonocnema kinseyi TaxID=2817044 RepID=UPI00143D5E32|nr:uncharacterized protein DDB_G0283697-like isoform X3 [Belonocnema kinseyi]